MADTIRTKAALLALLADNTTHDIVPQNIRDFLVSSMLVEDGVFAVVSVPAETTCAVAGTYYRVLGTWLNETIESWSVPAPNYLLTCDGCDGTDGYKYKIIVNASFTSDTGSNLISLGLYVNGVLHAHSVMTTYIKNTSEETMTSLVVVDSFDIGDTIEIRVAASQAGSKVTAQKLTTCLSRFF